MTRFAAVFFASIFLCGCAALGESCPAGLSTMTEVELYFGRSLSSGEEVSDADWQRFVDEEITPRFPDGLSIENAYGQWKGASGIIRERSKHLTIIILGKSSADPFAAIRAAYKARFHQESVLLLETPGCGSF